MEVAPQSTQVLDKHSLKSCEHNLEFAYAAKDRARELSARIVAGRDPRSLEGDLARKQAGKMGSRVWPLVVPLRWLSIAMGVCGKIGADCPAGACLLLLFSVWGVP
jgi:hypothetical protein